MQEFAKELLIAMGIKHGQKGCYEPSDEGNGSFPRRWKEQLGSSKWVGMSNVYIGCDR